MKEIYGFYAKALSLFLERSAKSALLRILLLLGVIVGVLETNSSGNSIEKQYWTVGFAVVGCVWKPSFLTHSDDTRC